jgi:hypothetical protein
MTPIETAEHEKLSLLWATGRATKKQILRCLVLTRQAEHATEVVRLLRRVAELDTLPVVRKSLTIQSVATEARQLLGRE